MPVIVMMSGPLKKVLTVFQNQIIMVSGEKKRSTTSNEMSVTLSTCFEKRNLMSKDTYSL
jgi:hypothetical protein